MDDVIVILLNHYEQYSSQQIAEIFVQVFESIDENIKFTFELPDESGFLRYLDVKFSFDRDIWDWHVLWTQKDCHSGNHVHFDSHVNPMIKRNFVTSRLIAISRRVSNTKFFLQAVQIFFQQCLNNSYPLDLLIKKWKTFLDTPDGKKICNLSPFVIKNRTTTEFPTLNQFLLPYNSSKATNTLSLIHI